MKAYWGRECIAPRNLDIGTGWRWVVRFTLRPLYPQGKTPGTLWIGGWVGPRAVLDVGVRRKIPSSYWDSNSDNPVRSPALYHWAILALDPILCVSFQHMQIIPERIKNIIFYGYLHFEIDDRGSRVRFPAGAGNFSLHDRVQNGSGAHTASYPMGTRGSFSGVKWPGREADHSPLCSAEVNWVELYLHLPHTPP
jgi:hypothetical protein